ncbi:MAG TPA: hypothetical protein VLH75_19890 [Longimicrobiales bacterium]|nr:hypothetical protein [Longimicrobiales bacterium]
MIPLDLRTLVAANAVVWVFSSLILAVLWRSGRTYPGSGLWAIHAGLVTAGFAIFGARGFAPEPLSTLGGNGLFGLGILLAPAGLRRFLGAPAPW